MAGSEAVVEQLLKKQQVKKDRDVEELYLANRKLTDVHDLQRFRFVKIIWLNNNLLRKLTCLEHTLRLRELYLHNNQLVELGGAVGQLVALEVLTLHNNQLMRLDACVNELYRISNLRVLNLFNNPLAQEPEYRLFVIHTLSMLELLDRHAVLPQERLKAQHLFGATSKIQDTIAFGRRSLGPPAIFFPSTHQQRLLEWKGEGSSPVGNNHMKNRKLAAMKEHLKPNPKLRFFDKPRYIKPPFDSVDEAFENRRKVRSATVFSFMDWSKVPKLEERRQLLEPFKMPEMITCVFR